MKCPECQTENPDTQKFCGECGAKLEKVCPGCGIHNPPQYKYCGECGRNLDLASETAPKELSFDEKIDKIQRYLPKGLTEKILSRRDKSRVSASKSRSCFATWRVLPLCLRD